MPNFKSVVYFLVVDFGGGCRCRCRSCCDRGKTKSNPSPLDLDWNGLGLEFDNKQSYFFQFLVGETFLIRKS